VVKLTYILDLAVTMFLMHFEALVSVYTKHYTTDDLEK